MSESFCFRRGRGGRGIAAALALCCAAGVSLAGYLPHIQAGEVRGAKATGVRITASLKIPTGKPMPGGYL